MFVIKIRIYIDMKLAGEPTYRTYMKLRIIAFASFFVAACGVQAQQAPDLLLEADSLFAQKKYTEAYNLYHHIFHEHKQSSPEMLVKMAFINEGQGDYSGALYFLNLYYHRSPDRAVLKKMETLAREHRLKGYEYSDFSILESFYYKYSSMVILALTALAFLLLAAIYRVKTRKRERPIGLFIAYAIVLALLVYVFNFGVSAHKGIITSEYAYVMDNPSAASRLVDVTQQGHRVKIVGENDIWLKIKWNGENAYIRKQNVAQLF